MIACEHWYMLACSNALRRFQNRSRTAGTGPADILRTFRRSILRPLLPIHRRQFAFSASWAARKTRPPPFHSKSEGHSARNLGENRAISGTCPELTNWQNEINGTAVSPGSKVFAGQGTRHAL